MGDGGSCPSSSAPIVPPVGTSFIDYFTEPRPNREIEVVNVGGHTPTYYLYTVNSDGSRGYYVDTLPAWYFGCSEPTSSMIGQKFWILMQNNSYTNGYKGRKA